MEFVKTYLVALGIFLAMDSVWLGFVARNLYRSQLGKLIADKPNWLAAGVFYGLFLVGLVVFVLRPLSDDASLVTVALRGAFFGLVTYATYDLTNLATLKGWPLTISLIDMGWGMVLGGTVSTLTYAIVK